MAIAFKEGAGALWWNKKLRLTPRFEIRMKININKNGCSDSASYSIDGFALILSKQTNFLGGDGNNKGFGGIYDALVTEIDLYGNPGEISSNFVRLNRCYNQYCRADNSGSVSNNLPFYYNKCLFMIYDVRLEYSYGAIKIFVNDNLIIHTNEDLQTKFRGFSYFGLSGFFRGNQREFIVSNESYICTDKITSVKISTLHQGIRTQDAIPNNIPAGSIIEVEARFADYDGQIIPHFKEDNIIDWNLDITYDCFDNNSSWDPNKFIDMTTIKTKVKINLK